MKRAFFAAVAVVLFLSLGVPGVWAAPQVLPTTSSTTSYTSARHVVFADLAGPLVRVELTVQDPSGNFFVISDITTSFTSVTTTTCGGLTAPSLLDVTNTVAASPVDGTFVYSGVGRGANFLVHCSEIAGKSILFCLKDGRESYVANTNQFWNWHLTTTSFNDDGTPGCVFSGQDTVLQPQEDPNNSVFFSDQAPTDNDPQGFTTNSAVTCPGNVALMGVWIRGSTQSSNTFASFYHVQGPVSPLDQDLRDNLGALNTGYVDDGAGETGDHTATVFYNNAVGNSYQISVKSGVGGTEQLGAVLFAAPNQCNIIEPNLLGFTLDPNELFLSVSQAQCSGDQVEFDVNRVPPGVGTLANLNVTIIDGDTNLAVMLIDDSQMFIVAPPTPPRLLHFNRTLSPGPWVAVVLEDNTVSTDHFMGRSFNVPQGDCTGGTFVCGDPCEVTVEPFLQGTNVGDTSTENLLILLTSLLVCWFIWSRSKDWGIKFGIPLLVVILFLASLTFVDAWRPMVVFSVLLLVTAVWMVFKTSSDFAKNRKEATKQKEVFRVTD